MTGSEERAARLKSHIQPSPLQIPWVLPFLLQDSYDTPDLQDTQFEEPARSFSHYLSFYLNPDNTESRAILKGLFGREVELFTPRFDISLPAQRDLAYRRLKKVCDAKVLSVTDFDNNPANVFTVHEVVAMADPSLATKLTVQFNLFGGTLFKLGTEKHHFLVPSIDRLAQVGCFALTELGYGNNAVQMETTATFDTSRRGFFITSPTVLSQKYWITNGALHAHWAIVFAQLILPDGRCEGVHAFLVRIREDTMKVCQGVTIEDMGVKIGCNGVDNAKLTFRNVFVPCSQMLDRISQIKSDGVFESNVIGIRQRFLTQSDQLLSGRLCIASMMLGSCKVVLVTTLRYSETRMSAGASGLSDTPIGTYQLQQLALIPLLAKTVLLNIFLNEVKQKFHLFHCKDHTKTAFHVPPAVKPMDALGFEVMLLCCAIKPYLAWHAETVASTCRERSGGQGYLSANMLGEHLAFSHAGMSAEGDNCVLWQKVAKELLSATYDMKFQHEVAKGWKQRDNSLKEFPSTQTNRVAGFSIRHISELLQRRELARLSSLQNLMKVHQGKDSVFDAWMHSYSSHVQSLAKAFTERRIFDAGVDLLLFIGHHERPTKEVQQVVEGLTSFMRISGVSFLLADAAWFGGEDTDRKALLTLEELGLLEASLRRQVAFICDSKFDYIRATVASLGVPEEILFAPIAKDWVSYNVKEFPMQGEITRCK